jgi:FAD dependent oxidoreductase
MKLRTLLPALLAVHAAAADVIEADVVIYGGTAGGVAAACTVMKSGKRAVLAEFGRHIGGLTSGGLGYTDIGNKAAIGGFSREFYRRLGKVYGKPEAWTFAPSVAERELLALIEENKVPVRFTQRLASVKKDGTRIAEIAMEDGTIYRGKVFIDATYEGDLMARAGVSYMVGREANERFNETLNGARDVTPKHQFIVPVDPYVKPGDPSSGVLPLIDREPIGKPGAGDASIQAYNFRLCLTNNPANQLPIKPPPGYDPARYELCGRYLEALAAAGKTASLGMFLKVDMVTADKTDINNNGAFSTDYIGMNHAYADATHADRERIWNEHLHYIQGLLTFFKTDPRVPAAMRADMAKWGLCKDEFTDTGGWPHQMYVREARRMLGELVMTERVCRQLEKPDDSVGLGAYNMDSHNCRRIIRDGRVENEGDVQTGVKPYPISYRSLTPRAGECTNLLVPVCLSATHIAYGSIRMEPVFMILGQSAASAAVIAIDDAVTVQKISYPKLRAQLLKDAQVLEWRADLPGQSGGNPGREPAAKLPGIVADDADAKKLGDWQAGSLAGRVGTGYIHDGNTAKGEMSVTWTPEIPQAAEYEIILHFSPNPNRATNVPVSVTLAGGDVVARTVNQQDKAGSASLGKYKLGKGKPVTITLSNKGSNGHVIADGVQLLPVK